MDIVVPVHAVDGDVANLSRTFNKMISEIRTQRDEILEAIGDGYDSVQASVDYVLGDNVERLILIGAAITGTGNAIDNVIVGTVGSAGHRGDGDVRAVKAGIAAWEKFRQSKH